VVTNPIAKTGESNFRNIVLVFKFKKKGIAALKLVPEAYFASNTFCLWFSNFFSEIIWVQIQISPTQCKLSDSKIRGIDQFKQINFILI